MPSALSISVIGNKFIELKSRPSGIKKSVVNREINIVSISERIVTISAEKKIKYAGKYKKGTET